MASYYSLFSYVTVLLLTHHFWSAQSDQIQLNGPNVCHTIKQSNTTNIICSVGENTTNEACNKSVITTHINTSDTKVINSIKTRCCDGFVESSNTCIPLQRNDDAYKIIGVLIVIAVIILLFMYINSRNACNIDMNQKPESSSKAETESMLYSVPYEKNSMLSTSTINAYRTADGSQSVLNKQHMNDASHMMEAGYSRYLDGRQPRVVESVYNSEPNRTFIMDEVTKDEGQEHIYETLDEDAASVHKTQNSEIQV